MKYETIERIFQGCWFKTIASNPNPDLLYIVEFRHTTYNIERVFSLKLWRRGLDLPHQAELWVRGILLKSWPVDPFAELCDIATEAIEAAYATLDKSQDEYNRCRLLMDQEIAALKSQGFQGGYLPNGPMTNYKAKQAVS